MQKAPSIKPDAFYYILKEVVKILLGVAKGGCENAFRGSRRALHPAAYTITISYYHI